MIGQRLQQYLILEKTGERVADDHGRERFAREAKAASARSTTRTSSRFMRSTPTMAWPSSRLVAGFERESR
jgi:hypothetical protein